MGILSKLVLFLLIFYVQISGSYIRKVIVNNSHSKQVSQQFINQFQGSIAANEQINLFIIQMKKKGYLNSIDYELIDSNTGAELYFNLSYNPKITAIQFKNLPILKTKVESELSNKVGDFFNYRYLTLDIQKINQLLFDDGYFLSSVMSVQLNDRSEMVIQIESPVVIHTDFIGLGSIPEWYVKRDLLLKNNQIIKKSLLDIDYNFLQSLPTFSTVMPPKINYVTSDNVLVSYKVKPKKPNRFDVGIEELEDNEGVALFAKLKHFNNLIYSDFIEFQTQLGYLNELDVRTYQLHYAQPWLFNRYPVSFDFNLFTKYRSEVYQNDQDVYKTIRTGGSFFFTKSLKLLKFNIGAGTRYERVSPQTSGDFQSYDLRSIGFFIDQNNVSNFTNPKSGYRSKISYDLGGDIVGLDVGGVSFSRFSVNHSHYFPITDTQVFAARLFGGVFKKQSSISTFESEKFSLGGANSLRGYQEFAMYGNYRFSFNLEQRIMLNKYTLFALFYDAGYINDSFELLFDDYYQGYGFGFRWFNTFMPVRLDFGFGDDFIIHLSVSQTF